MFLINKNLKDVVALYCSGKTRKTGLKKLKNKGNKYQHILIFGVVEQALFFHFYH